MIRRVESSVCWFCDGLEYFLEEPLFYQVYGSVFVFVSVVVCSSHLYRSHSNEFYFFCHGTSSSLSFTGTSPLLLIMIFLPVYSSHPLCDIEWWINLIAYTQASFTWRVHPNMYIGHNLIVILMWMLLIFGWFDFSHVH